MSQKLVNAVTELLDWLPIYSKNSSGYMRRLAVEEALSQNALAAVPADGEKAMAHEYACEVCWEKSGRHAQDCPRRTRMPGEAPLEDIPTTIAVHAAHKTGADQNTQPESANHGGSSMDIVPPAVVPAQTPAIAIKTDENAGLKTFCTDSKWMSGPAEKALCEWMCAQFRPLEIQAGMELLIAMRAEVLDAGRSSVANQLKEWANQKLGETESNKVRISMDAVVAKCDDLMKEKP